MLKPLINGVSYSYSQIIVNIMGVPIFGIQSINYGHTQEIENIYGAGVNPVSRGYGNKVPTASFTILMEEVQNIMSAIPSRDLTDIPEFDISVIYVDDSLRVPTVTHVVRNCRFLNNNISSNQNDKSIPITLDVLPSHIDYNP